MPNTNHFLIRCIQKRWTPEINQVLPIYIINLSHRQDRRKRASEQLERTGADFKFFPAINRSEGQKYFSGINRLICFLSLGRQPSDGEIGCYASHLALWKKCVELNHPIVVMEDDFLADDSFLAALEVVTDKIDSYEFIRLDSLKRGRFKDHHVVTITEHRSFAIDYMRRVPLNATAYALNPDAARRLILASHKFTCPTDNFFQRTWAHKQPMFVIRPESIQLDPLAEDSSIVESDRNKKSSGHRLARLLRVPYRIWSHIARVWVNSRNLSKIG
jgi:glycosyl transferase family 25